MMKTFLLLAVGSVVTAGVLPTLPAKIILSAFVLIAALTQAARRRPRRLSGRERFSPYQRATSCDKGPRPAARLEKNVDELAFFRFAAAGEGLNAFLILGAAHNSCCIQRDRDRVP